MAYVQRLWNRHREFFNPLVVFGTWHGVWSTHRKCRPTHYNITRTGLQHKVMIALLS